MGWRGVCPAFTRLVSSVCQMQSAHDQTWAFRCGEMAIFTDVCDVQWMSVLLSGVNITFDFSKLWKFGATLTGVCGGDTLAFWAFFTFHVIHEASSKHLTWLTLSVMLALNWAKAVIVASRPKCARTSTQPHPHPATIKVLWQHIFHHSDCMPRMKGAIASIDEAKNSSWTKIWGRLRRVRFGQACHTAKPFVLATSHLILQ